jgi:hypothetical protein
MNKKKSKTKNKGRKAPCAEDRISDSRVMTWPGSLARGVEPSSSLTPPHWHRRSARCLWSVSLCEVRASSSHTTLLYSVLYTTYNRVHYKRALLRPIPSFLALLMCRRARSRYDDGRKPAVGCVQRAEARFLALSTEANVLSSWHVAPTKGKAHDAGHQYSIFTHNA